MSMLVVRFLAFCLVVGTVQAQTAKLQVIHNSADPGASVVDVWVNGDKAIDDFAFRTASPFIDVPTTLQVGIAPPSSTAAGEAIYTRTFNLTAGETYVVVANGVLNPSAFAPNNDPAAAPTAFDLYVISPARSASVNAGEVDLVVFHGATDAPAVDVLAGGQALVSGMSYGQSRGYLSVPPGTYQLGIAPSGGEAIATFTADLSSLGGVAVTVVASGFLSAEANQNGPAFGLFAAAPSGGPLIELPVVTEAKALVQVIHNAADPTAALVDVYVNGQLAVDNFAFRTATPFVELPANTDLSFAIAGPGSTSASDALATFNYNLPEGRYVVVANGVVSAGFAPNPDPRAPAITFNLYPIGDVPSGASGATNVDFAVFHGATDAPAVDVYANGSLKLISDLVYGENTEFTTVPASTYDLGVAPAGGSIIATFRADLNGLAGQSIVVVASGFLNPASNNNGAAFGLFAATSAGGALVELPATTASVDEGASALGMMLSPNPASSVIAARTMANIDPNSSITVSTLTGEVMPVTLLGWDGMQAMIDIQALPVGFYLVSVRGNAQTITAPFVVSR